MPRRDGTGPDGQGPKTGRQMGGCKGAKPMGNMKGCGKGRGMGRQRGRSSK
jgi:hypothetical protein